MPAPVATASVLELGEKSTDTDRTAAEAIAGAAAANRRSATAREGSPKRRGGSADDQHLGDEESCDSHPAATERSPDGGFVFAREAPRVQHVREIRARADQDQRRKREQPGPRSVEAAATGRQHVGERTRVDDEVRVAESAGGLDGVDQQAVNTRDRRRQRLANIRRREALQAAPVRADDGAGTSSVAAAPRGIQTSAPP